jgi:hypothetical protein
VASDLAEIPTGASRKQAGAIICSVFRDNTEKYTVFELSNRSVSPLSYGQHFYMLLLFRTLTPNHFIRVFFQK